MEQVQSQPEKDNCRPLLSGNVGDGSGNQANDEYASDKTPFYQYLEMVKTVSSQTTSLFGFSKEQAGRINDLRNKVIDDVNEEVHFFVETVSVDVGSLYDNIRMVVLQRSILDCDNEELKNQILEMHNTLLVQFHQLTKATYENAESLTFLLHNALISDAASHHITMKSVESELSRLLFESWEFIAQLRHRSGVKAKMFTDQVHAKTVNSDDSPKD
ncbi:unnamed protein product [Caenorhabditis brenneri]